MHVAEVVERRRLLLRKPLHLALKTLLVRAVQRKVEQEDLRQEVEQLLHLLYRPHVFLFACYDKYIHVTLVFQV